MRKRKMVVAVVILVQIVLTIMSFVGYSEAYLNGKGTDDTKVFPDGFDPSDPADRQTFYQECYSTHDWIACRSHLHQ